MKHQYAFSRIVDDMGTMIGADENGNINQLTDDVWLIQELVDRATPLKPTTNYFHYYCLNCLERLGYYDTEKGKYNFCPHCGRPIDWSEDENIRQ